jgi:putative nucleotidyltransferase with HDIG domain
MLDPRPLGPPADLMLGGSGVDHVCMTLEPNLEEEQLLADNFRRAGAKMTPRERLAEWLVGSGFVAAVAALWVIYPPRDFDPVPTVLCLAVLVLATTVTFDTPLGFTVPTQLAFVPLLFAMPVATVPVGVAAAIALARLGAVLRGTVSPGRLLTSPGNAWFSVGPAAVFAIAGVEPANAGAALLLAALGAQFLVDFSASAVRIAIARDASFSSQLSDAWWVYLIDASLSGVGLVVARDITSQPAAVLVLVPLLGVLAIFARERHRRLESLLELSNAYRGTALVLGDVVEADDGYTGEHCKGVLELALAVADRLGLDAHQRRNVEFGALLHDIGKIAIPKQIINKPGRLDPKEWLIIKTHTIEGQKMLDRVGGFMHEVGLIVRSHHERWDGDGYPDRLAGEAIPLEARIIACCDAWNAMRTDRSYRKALSYEEALVELCGNRGAQFDPAVLDALAGIVEAAESERPTNRTPQAAAPQVRPDPQLLTPRLGVEAE